MVVSLKNHLNTAQHTKYKKNWLPSNNYTQKLSQIELRTAPPTTLLSILLFHSLHDTVLNETQKCVAMLQIEWSDG